MFINKLCVSETSTKGDHSITDSLLLNDRLWLKFRRFQIVHISHTDIFLGSGFALFYGCYTNNNYDQMKLN